MVQNKEILIQRKQYTQKLKSWLGQNDLVKIVTGVRRCGKSKLFVLFQKELLKNKIATKNTIISINLEDVLQTREIGLTYNDSGFLADYNKLLDYVTSKLVPNKINFVFIDEVQLLENWQLAANALKLIENVDLYLTGSNAYMFSGDLANSFGGRYVEIKMQPFSFREYCEASKEIELQNNPSLKQFVPNYNLQELYSKYLKESGFPQTIKFNSDTDLIYDYLMNTVYLNTVQKDIISRYGITDVNKLNSVIRYIFDNIGNETSLRGIERGLKASGQNISVPTLTTYLQGLMDSYLVYKCDRYDIKGKKYLDSSSKFYVADIGLRNAILGSSDRDLGHILENIVYLELLRRGYSVSVGKITKLVRNGQVRENKTVEIDFIAKKKDQIEYYQVALNALEPEILQRELAPLEEIKDNYPKYLLTMDYGSGDNNGIKRMNVLQWLFNEEPQNR